MSAEEKFFVPEGSPVTDNFVTPLSQGEEAWGAVKANLIDARQTIELCFWAIDSKLELERPLKYAISNPDYRKSETLLSILEQKAKENVIIRILIWSATSLPYVGGNFFVDRLINLAGMNGQFEVLYQPHPNRKIGSWHQKTIVIDGLFGFISGMNAKQNDWDTNEHHLFDIRRAEHSLDLSERKKINLHKDYKAINKPRRDYMVHIMGPAVAIIRENFIERWNYCIKKTLRSL